MRQLTFNKITWIDLEGPRERDLQKIRDEYKIHPIIYNQLSCRTSRPYIEKKRKQLFFVLHFPVYYPVKKQTWPTELDFIITPKALITIHHQPIPYLDTFYNDCKLQSYYQKKYFKNRNRLLFGLLSWLHKSCLPMLDKVSKKIEDVEKHVFEGQEKHMLGRIALIKRDLIDFRQAIKPQTEALRTLKKESDKFFSEKTNHRAGEVVDSSEKVWNVLEDYWEWITSIEQTNNSLLSYKLSDIMRFLTALSFIMFPLNIMVGFLGMNIHIPIIKDTPHGWLIVLAIMFSATITMALFFKKKKWL